MTDDLIVNVVQVQKDIRLPFWRTVAHNCSGVQNTFHSPCCARTSVPGFPFNGSPRSGIKKRNLMIMN